MTIEEMKAKGLVLFECISGSRAYGLATKDSDTDIRGVFYLPKELFYGLTYIPQISNETNDVVYYELGRFIELLSKNNPNILELLATPEAYVLYKHPILEKVRLADFLSKLTKDTFAGYALSQMKKAKGLNKKVFQPMDRERKDLLDFCYVLEEKKTVALKNWLERRSKQQAQCGLAKVDHMKGLYALYYDEDRNKGYKGIVYSDMSNQVCLSSIPKNDPIEAYFLCKMDEYSSYCKQYKEYWDWIEKRNETRYQTTVQHGGGYDSKNMMHTMRLLLIARDIGKQGTLEVFTPYRAELLQIKAGHFTYEELLERVAALHEEIEQLYETSSLMEKPVLKKTEELLVEMRNELYSS
ncbi:nucleotidyltransferase domain-containing protein [Myroides sp. DF42-4-2]|uniref:nucleotidyltransferase domain-containing protein n=1 Tax=unclassified Myroides TaxID=2642485 RepID=UPI002575F85C|nr:nucleotidyltransferase domain-containing protein [Myroides sp. DF42-4-2]MDM1408067.1 nucleotidyltransferase domain-containing protein [Myroides sp. DF42-4-2]